MRTSTDRRVHLLLWGTVLILACLSVPGHLWSCEPCRQVLSLEESARRADLIVVGERTNYSPQERQRLEGPAVAEIRVIQVLKGPDPGRRIQADAWYGMCDYGMVVDAKHYVMFLAKTSQGGFRTLNNGCAVKVLLLKDQRVEIDGKPISLEEFRKTITSKSKNSS